MEVTFDPKVLKQIAGIYSKIISPNDIPVWRQYIYIKAEDGDDFASFVASNEFLYVVTCIPILNMKSSGEVNIPASEFTRAVFHHSGNITLKKSKSKLQITSSRTSKKNRLAMPEIDYMLADPPENTAGGIQMPVDGFWEAIQHVSFSASNSTEKAILQGVNISVKNESISTVATDGTQLASVNNVPIDISSGVEFELLLHKIAISNFSKWFEVCGDTVTLFEDDGYAYMFAHNGAGWVRFSPVVGKYPQWQPLISVSTSASRWIINPQDLIAELAFVQDQIQGISIVRLHINATDKNSMSISNADKTYGDHQTTYSLQPVSVEDDLLVYLNSRVLISHLSALSNFDEIEIIYNGQLKPLLLRPVGSSTIMHIVVAQNIQE